MAKYGKSDGEKVEKAMREMKDGTLKTGPEKKVSEKDQADAIRQSQSRKEGGQVPHPPGGHQGDKKESKGRK